MMKTRLFLMAAAIMVAATMTAQTFTGVLREAKTLKDSGSYLEAAEKYRSYRQQGVTGRALLDVLFPEAECYYMLDDYQQLDTMVTKYIACFRTCRGELGDSLDVYKAWLFKMLGNSKYGVADASDEGLMAAEQARKYYVSSMEIFARRGNADNVNVLLEELAQLFYKAEAYASALKFLAEVKDYYQRRLDMGIDSDAPKYYRTLSQMALCNARMAAAEKYSYRMRELFAASIAQIDSAIAFGQKVKVDDRYEWLRIKGKILMMQYDELDIDNRLTAKGCYEQYVNYQRNTVGRRLQQMSPSQQEQSWLALHKFLFDCYRLGGDAPEMLYDLALFGKNYLVNSRETGGKEVRWQDVRKVLAADACALEFVQYRGSGDASRLGCFVLKKDSQKPQFVEIGETNSILGRVLNKYYGLNVEACMTYQHGSISLPGVKNLLYTDSLLPRQIWTAELMAAIGSATKVYFAPDGFLHQIAIEYIMPDTAKTCYRLSSTRVLTEKRQPVDYSKLLVCGGMDYDTKLSPHTSGNDIRAYNFFAGNGTVSDLPATQKEIRAIIDTRANAADRLLTGRDATDENFKEALTHGYSLVHVSTHGYFAGEMSSGTDLKPATSDGSLSKSGLIFAGATSALTDKQFNTAMFDGVLSATEVAQFDMRGVDLVTLSACQTALGDITADGIFGMQRALKTAGVRGMMVSLWSVGDTSSYLLFKYFYEELQNQEQKDIRKAFDTARARLKKHVEYTPYFNMQTLDEDVYASSFNLPYDTCPYILIDIY